MGKKASYAISSDAEFCRMIYETRKRKGLTQEALAKLCGIDQANISRIENHGRIPSFNTMHRIASVLGLNFTLVEGE
ncbi:MAG: helix-turn-helix domain-containing protein [Clostridia bacterium]|nr:helix-turn-helix domain-containing protein [Clostridia bacterium]